MDLRGLREDLRKLRIKDLLDSSRGTMTNPRRGGSGLDSPKEMAAFHEYKRKMNKYINIGFRRYHCL